MIEKEKAIYVRNLSKRYGRSRKAQFVLDNLDMTVEKGTIYGLLGASGCGKTTLLTCIVGRKSITSGEIWVLGGKPGSEESGVPGPRLGYMPQEIALMRQFTIKDAINHFGWIYGMKNGEIMERMEFLSELLDLPPIESKIKNLSIGQQRRVSLAVALVQDPELIILDEPTVGLDPVLRQKIWNYLLEAATKHDKTVIITTHYIEEARQAHRIGLMRNGKLLAEDTPEKLMEIYDCDRLEQVFFKLSYHQEGKGSREAKRGNNPTSVTFPNSRGVELGEVIVDADSTDEGNRFRKTFLETVKFSENVEKTNRVRPIGDSMKSPRWKFKCTTKGHAKALLSKNWFRLTRHPGAIIFVFFFPMLELCSFFFAIGGQPKGLKLGVINEELGNYTTCDEFKKSLGSRYGGNKINVEDDESYCEMEGLSCKFLDKIHDELVIKTPYSDASKALEDARKGKLIAVIYFYRNFSKEFEFRLDGIEGNPSDEAVEKSQILVWLDKSRRQSAQLLEKKLLDLHGDFIDETFAECQIRPKVGKIPIKFHEPIYGNSEGNFTRFMTPGVITTMIFFLAVSVTATIMVVERLDGIWDRTLLAGVTSTEILISHIVLEAGVICLQVFEVIVFVFFIFGMPCAGSYLDIVILLVLQGFCGMCGGFLVSVSCNTVTASNFISMGSFYPVLIFSGLLWPIEGMPSFLKTISVGMPTTLATLSMRNIMEKGWRLTRAYVYEGYLISIMWICLFSLASIVIARARK